MRLQQFAQRFTPDHTEDSEDASEYRLFRRRLPWERRGTLRPTDQAKQVAFRSLHGIPHPPQGNVVDRFTLNEYRKKFGQPATN